MDMNLTEGLFTLQTQLNKPLIWDEAQAVEIEEKEDMFQRLLTRTGSIRLCWSKAVFNRIRTV